MEPSFDRCWQHNRRRSLKLDNEVNMIEKIAKDISNKLNEAPNMGFEDMVGIEAHLQKIQPLLHLQCDDEALILGISGPAGIGKTTIARALHSRLSSSFQLTCFMENLKGINNSSLDDYGLKLWLQEQLLSKILNQNDMSIYHLGAIPERLRNLKVLIILDDVDDLKQLEALANDTAWFGPGSRVIVITKDQELLRQHSIDNEYHVDFPTSEEALEILCRYAFRQSSPPDGFKELSEKVTELCCNLPSRLRMVGSPLRGKNQKEWENVMHRLENEKSLSNKRIGKGRSWYSTGMAFLLVINLLMEIVSAIADQLSSNRKPHFARISLVMSVTSILVSLLDLTLKVRAHKARFICKWPIPWFYYPSRGYNRIFGSFTDTVLLFCVAGNLVVSGINYSRIEKRQDGPIKVSVWPLFFAIGMVISKFMEKPANSKDILPITKMY